MEEPLDAAAPAAAGAGGAAGAGAGGGGVAGGAGRGADGGCGLGRSRSRARAQRGSAARAGTGIVGDLALTLWAGLRHHGPPCFGRRELAGPPHASLTAWVLHPHSTGVGPL